MFGVHTGRHKQFCDMLAEYLGSELGSFLEALKLLFFGRQAHLQLQSAEAWKPYGPKRLTVRLA